MRFRRHIPPLHEWQLPGLDARGAKRWGVALFSSLVAGYLTAYLVVFPAPILRGHQVVPRVLGLSLQEASAELRKAGLQVQDGGSDPHPTAAQGTVIWQDPPPGVSATVLAPGAPVTVVVSRGAPTIPVPGLLGLSQADARARLELEGLTLGTVTRRRTADANPGTVVAQRPAAGTLAAAGTVVDIVVARSPQ